MKNEIKETKELAKRIEKMAKENHLPEYLIRLVIGAEEVFVKKEEISEYLNKKTSSLSSDLRAPEKFADFCLSEAKTTNDMNYFRVLQNLCPNEKYLKEIREIWDNFILNKLEQLKPVGTGYIGMVNRLRLASRSGSEARKKATILYIESESNLTFVKSVVANLSGSQKNDAEIMAKLEIFLQRKLKEAKTNQNCALLYETAKDWQAKLSTITIIAQKWSRYINELDVFVAFNKNSYYFAVVRTKLFIKKWDKAVLIALDKTNGVLEKKILFEKTRPASRAYKKVYEAWVLSSKSELTKAKTEEELLKAIQNAPKDKNFKADLESAQERLLKVRRKKLRGIKRLDILYYSFPYYTDSKDLSHSFKLEILRKEISLADNFMDLASALVKLSGLKDLEGNSVFKRLESQLFKKMLSLGEKQNYETLVNNGLLRPEYQKKLIKSLAKKYAII